MIVAVLMLVAVLGAIHNELVKIARALVVQEEYARSQMLASKEINTRILKVVESTAADAMKTAMGDHGRMKQ